MQFRYNYRGMGEWLVGPESQAMVRAKAVEAATIYQAIVAKRTGALSESAQVSTRIGGLSGRRWFGVLTVGDGVDYGASHEFGTDDGDERITAAAHDLRVVLENLQ